MPRCAGASGSVRTSSMQCVAHMPIDVHTLVPFTTKWSSSSTARQRRPARSLPASGSLNPWHHTSSAVRMRCRCTFCSGVPAAAMVGPTFFVPNTAMRRGALARPNSASHAIWSSTPSARPPISTGHAGADQPRAPSSRWNSSRPVPLVGVAPPLAMTRDDLVEDGAELQVRLHRREHRHSAGGPRSTREVVDGHAADGLAGEVARSPRSRSPTTCSLVPPPPGPNRRHHRSRHRR